MRNELEKIAERRLRPSLSDPNYLVLRSRRIIFERWISGLNHNLAILDIGGRYQPYRPLLANKLRKYVAIDLVPTPLVNILADGQQLPLASETFDLVISTQVFEYMPRPDLAANEIHRVLKPGGMAFLSVPAFAPRFGSEEHWRFTATGIRSIMNSFAEIEIVPELHSFAGVVRCMNLSLAWFFAQQRAAGWLYNHSVGVACNLGGLGIEKLGLTSNDQFATNYSVRAVKAAA